MTLAHIKGWKLYVQRQVGEHAHKKYEHEKCSKIKERYTRIILKGGKNITLTRGE